MNWKDKAFWAAIALLSSFVVGVTASMFVAAVQMQRQRTVELREWVWETRRELKAEIAAVRKQAENAENRIEFLEQVQDTD